MNLAFLGPQVRRAVCNFASINFKDIQKSSLKKMNNVNNNCDLEDLRLKIRSQGDIVKKLKETKASENDIKQAVNILKNYKKSLEQKEIKIMSKDLAFDRAKMEDLLKQRFFYDQSFAIYGGVQGLYDYGPMGCAMKANLLSAWRQFFILEEHLLEVDCSILTPESVLQASGHVDRFTDLMVKDKRTGECFRADHLVESSLEAIKNDKKTSAHEKEEIERIIHQIDNYGSKELCDLIFKYSIKSPTTGNELTEPQTFNLMFETSIGPTGQLKGYLRPETAQGIFVNFQRLLQFNQGKLPFGAAQIGSSFRNEISPRSGLIRVREFTMAEIEYFIDPANKNYPKFDGIRLVEMNLYSANDQLSGDKPRTMTIGDAVDKGIVANETLGYFMARIYMFLVHIGVDPNRLRFRQHMSNEMAHYACDCWDAECQTSYGWIECVGCADRSCYDLNQHAKSTGTRLVAEKPLNEPKTVEKCECVPNKKVLGSLYRGDAKLIMTKLSSLSLEETKIMKMELEESGKVSLRLNDKHFELDKSVMEIREFDEIVHVEEVVPNVIEPSFGIGRILYVIFEHSFRIREGDEQRSYLSVSPILAPYKCSVLPLTNNSEISALVHQLSVELTKVGVSHRVDDGNGSIGRRYARTDQIAIPYGVTVDFDSIKKSPITMTLRERDSMKQIRVPMDELPLLVSNLSNNLFSWSDIQSKYPVFEQQETANLDVKKEKIVCNENDNAKKFTQSVEGNDVPCNKSKKVNSKNRVLNWSDWGKAIRKHYQEEELKESLTAQSSVDDPNQHARSHRLNSGYDADQEDNISVNFKMNDGENIVLDTAKTPNLQNYSKSTSSNETVQLSSNGGVSEWPTLLESNPSLKNHGLFVGNDWSGTNEKKDNSIIIKSTNRPVDFNEKNLTFNPIFSPLWNNYDLEQPLTTNEKFNDSGICKDAPKLDQDCQNHLVTPSGWSNPSNKENQKDPHQFNEMKVASDMNKKYQSNKTSIKDQVKRPKFDWTAVLSRLPESDLISEQFQLNDDANYSLTGDCRVKKHELGNNPKGTHKETDKNVHRICNEQTNVCKQLVKEPELVSFKVDSTLDTNFTTERERLTALNDGIGDIENQNRTESKIPEETNQNLKSKDQNMDSQTNSSSVYGESSTSNLASNNIEPRLEKPKSQAPSNPKPKSSNTKSKNKRKNKRR